MIARHTLTYIGSRGLAAALNMAALAAFTRLAPVETYGIYLFVLSWALVFYGATSQWPKFAFFALYDEARGPAQIATVAWLLTVMSALAGLCAIGAVATGLTEPRVAAAIVAAMVGMTLFEVTVEIARTRLAAATVGLSVVLRGALVLVLGSLALHWSGDPLILVGAVAVANVLAAIPAALTFLPLVAKGSWSREEARRFLVFGWPLAISLGFTALAQTVDRLIVANAIGAGDLGVYGAIGDFLRQSFVVFGEGVALSYMSIAKHDARWHGTPSAQPVLRQAVCTLTLIGAFGAVFFLIFEDVVVSILLGPSYRAAAAVVTPFLVAASVATMFRAYYFGQVIYFTRSSLLEAIASAAMLVTIGSLSYLLIPHYGVRGAAVAVACGQVLACFVFVFGARGNERMPVPLAQVAQIALCALATWAALAGLGLVSQGGPFANGLKFTILGAATAATAWHFDVFGIREVVARWSRRVA